MNENRAGRASPSEWSDTISRWVGEYSKDAPANTVRSLTEDISHAMMSMVQDGMSAKEAYEAVMSGVDRVKYAVRTMPAQVVRNARRGSRRRSSFRRRSR